MIMPSPADRYRSEEEAVQELFKALSTGLQFTSDMRLGRPLGTFERPRPRHAEVRRSGRSLHHVTISLSALRDIALKLAPLGSPLERRLGLAFDRAQSQLVKLDDPVFASVAEVQTRIKVEIIQQSVDFIREIVRDELGPELGVIAGFNAMDGD
jgi:predicted lipoprotein